MKKFVLILAAAAMLFGCKKKDDSPFKSSDSPIYIYGVDSPNKAASAQKLSVHDILLIDTIFMEYEWEGEYLANHGEIMGGKHRVCLSRFAFSDNNIDTINNRLIMKAYNVIPDGNYINELGGDFLRARNIFISKWYAWHIDTLGYIPNSVIRSAQADILDLWREGAIAEIYERFNESFYFTPCSGEEFRAIKEEIDWENEYNDLLPRHAETHLIRWD